SSIAYSRPLTIRAAALSCTARYIDSTFTSYTITPLDKTSRPRPRRSRDCAIMAAMSEANKRIARRVVEEMLSGKPKLASELFAPSIAPKQAQLAKTLLAAFPDLQIKADELIAEGDKVACRWRAQN